MKYEIVSLTRSGDRVSFSVRCENGTFKVAGSIVNGRLKNPWYDGNCDKMFQDIYSNKDKKNLLEELRKEWESISREWTEK